MLVDRLNPTTIDMTPYVYFALGATLLIGAGLFALRREHHALPLSDDDIDWL
jgi:hypothetical protein